MTAMAKIDVHHHFYPAAMRQGQYHASWIKNPIS
jgi:hypothetical protein